MGLGYVFVIQTPHPLNLPTPPKSIPVLPCGYPDKQGHTIPVYAPDISSHQTPHLISPTPYFTEPVLRYNREVTPITFLGQ